MLGEYVNKVKIVFQLHILIVIEDFIKKEVLMEEKINKKKLIFIAFFVDVNKKMK